MAPRSLLYDDGFINGGCQNEWPPGTDKDDEFLTWVSCYVITGFAISGFMLFQGNPWGIEYGNSERYVRKFAFMFFAFFMGLGTAFWAFDYQFYDIKTEESAMIARAGDAFTSLSMAGLLLATSLPLTGGPEFVEEHAEVFRRNLCILVYGIYAVLTLLVSCVPSGIYAISDGMRVDNNVYRTKGDEYFDADTWSSWISGAIVSLTCLVMIALQMLKGSFNEEAQATWIKKPIWIIGGASCMLFGLVMQQILQQPCGAGQSGYGSCWKDCPLPAPDFNHNALMHCFMAAAMAIFTYGVADTWSEDEPEPEKQPIIEKPEPEPEPAPKGDVEDEIGFRDLTGIN